MTSKPDVKSSDATKSPSNYGIYRPSLKSTTLEFVKTHRSLAPFKPIAIKSFAMITGKNGSGKTHLLEAICTGRVKTQFDLNEIQYYSYLNMVPNDSGTANSQQISAENNQLLAWVRQAEERYNDQFEAIAKEVGVELESERWNLLNVPASLLGGNILKNAPPQLVEDLKSLVSNFESTLNSLSSNSSEWLHAIRVLKQRTSRYCLAGLTQREINKLPFGWRGNSLFQQSFAHMFFAYFEKFRANRFKRLALDDGVEVEDYLTDEEFKKVHGEPPWIFVNRLLENAKLPFRITFPENAETTDFTPVLVDQQTYQSYPFSSLSSGEKILMSFAICLYHSNETRQHVPKPKLLLLDEIDASLHPLMCRQLMDVILQSIVIDQEINVIMTTHSPSTIALCPPDNIYIMNRGEGLEQVTKNFAISTLTAGVPTLAIEYEGRRQVFTEDKSDAYLFDKIYQVLKSELASERSLEFIPVANSKVEVSGCAQVKSIVKNLNEKGNTSVFGIIDWDKCNISKGNIFVVSEGIHYSVENIVFDPVIIAAAVLHDSRDYNDILELEKNFTYSAFIMSSDDTISQRVSNAIQRQILGPLEVQVPVNYIDKARRLVDSRFLRMKGHELKAPILSSFPILSRYKDRLTEHLVDNILTDVPRFLPNCVAEVFGRILNA